MRTYITSDMHFGHENIIKLCRRPYSSVEDMDNDFIEKINRLPNGSTLYYLGDFVMGNTEQFIKVFSKIKPTIQFRFITGNHDKRGLMSLNSKRYEYRNILSVSSYEELNYNGHTIILFHYPILEWNGFFRNALHLHGHCHGNIKYPEGLNRIADVSIDCSFYEIQPIEYWIEKLTSTK